jgi:class 3 adenylate cyclase
MEREDGFNEIDRMLVDNVAHMLAASIYSKRLRLAAESSNKVSREMLHSLIPAKVIEKIECFWDENTAEYQSRRSSSFIASQCSSIDDSDRDYNFDDNEFDLFDEGISSNKPTSAKEQQENKMERTKLRRQSIRQSIKNKIGLLNEMNRDEPADHVGVVIDTSAMELSSTHRALYAETVPNVCIIFTDIVRFSQISLGMKPIKVMDMLQDLFSRFDALCDRYGIQKLETIGDAFICTSPMFDENADKDHQQVALNALEMAKEMVKEARRVIVPKKGAMQTLEIRVGIHIGDLTCGVLGERLPKFTVFGSSVNLAARMEQACLPSRIRMTKDFYDLLPESESEVVEAREIIRAKNMGEVETYLLNPLLERGTNTLHTHWEEMGGSACSLYD